MTRDNHLHFPYPAYYLPVFLIALAGFINSLYLLFAHYQNYTSMYYASFCALSKAINCDTVAQSPWSIMLGLPVALWGAMGYLFWLILLLPLKRYSDASKPLWALLVVVGAIYSIASIVLGYVSATYIHSYCILCILSYAIAFALFFMCWLIRRRFCRTSLFFDIVESFRNRYLRKILIRVFSFLVLLVACFQIALPNYWDLKTADSSEDLNQGLTQEGYPWVGAENPTLTINEFSDYMCFQCKKMHSMLRGLVRLYPKQIRLVHRHFPMDHRYNPLVTETFHGGSGKMAIIALYALQKGQFWRVNDLLFEVAGQKEDFNTRTIAAFMKIPVGELTAALNDKYLRLMLKHDIAVGIDQGITGTPGFVIDSKAYLGSIPKAILEKLVPENEK